MVQMNLKIIYGCFLAASTLFSAMNVAAQPEDLVNENRILNPSIRTVQFYKGDQEMSFPALDLSQPGGVLTLEFDELGNDVEDYYISFYHCDADWQKSRLMPLEYFRGYTDYPISDVAASRSTAVRYVHHRVSFPQNPQDQFLISGNYLLYVYRDNDKNDVALTRRFVVTDNTVNIGTDLGLSANVSERRKLQAVNFYLFKNPQVNLTAPFADIRVMVMQNFRWDNMKKKMEPAYQYPNKLEYRFSSDNDFPGGNEYRMFDLRNVQRRNGRVREIVNTDSGMYARLDLDLPRASNQYFSEPDFNGQFFTGIKQFPGQDTEADYVHTQFLLKKDRYIPGAEVYIFGQLSDWKLKDRFRMNWRPEGGYERSVLLKQGIYNYHYVVWRPREKELDETMLEGSHFETENFYTILVYYRGPSDRSHRLVGLRHINFYDEQDGSR